jgi:hypothetical protein
LDDETSFPADLGDVLCLHVGEDSCSSGSTGLLELPGVERVQESIYRRLGKREKVGIILSQLWISGATLIAL